MRRVIENIKDSLQFFIRFLKSPSTVGSLIPSSSRLAKRIIRKMPYLDSSPHSRRYLEVGAGTGAFTEQIIGKLNPSDSLDIVEYDAHFCDILRRKFGNLLNVTIHEACILDFEEDRYDVVISGLPLNCFNADFVNQVFMKYQRLTKNRGYVSYFEYAGLARLKQLFLFGRSLVDFKRTLGRKQLFMNHFCEETDKIWLNLTPVRVHHCKLVVSQDIIVD